MKNLIIILCLLCVANYSFAQYPQPPQNLGGLNIAVRDTGGLIVRQTLVPPSYFDTTAANVNSFTSRYPGSLIYTYSDNIFWLRNSTATRWLNFFTGSASGQDTLFAELPAFFDSTTRPGSTILKILTKNGLISGGTVTVDSCNILDIMPTIVVLNYIQYSSDAIKLTVPPNASGFPRVDEVIDSLGTIVLRIGTPSSTPVGAPINPATEWILATYQIAAGATCVDVNQIIVWDQNVGTPTEWNLTTSGTITANGNNIDQPYHLTKAIFVSTYTSGSSLIFTYSSLLTAQATELFKFWVYLNGAFGSNQFIIQFLNGSTPVGIAAAFNSGFGFNPNDSNFYQQVVLPFSAFNLTNQQFDKVVITFQGNDLSGAKGLYLDYLQLQTGIINPGTDRGVLDFVHYGTDSIRLTTDDGRTFTVFDRGGGGAAITLQTNSVNNGSQTLLNLKQGTNVTLADDGVGGVTINATGSSVTPAALTKTDDTNVTLTLGGLPNTALLQATSLTLGWTGALAIARGGTNNGSLAVTSGGILYTDGTKVVNAGAGTAAQHLTGGIIPLWKDTAVASSGGGRNIYNADSTLAANRLVTMAGRTLDFRGSRVAFDSTTTGTDHSRVNTIINQDWKNSLPSGYSTTLSISYSATKATITGASSLGASAPAGTLTTTFTSAIQYTTARLPFEEPYFEETIIPQTKSAGACIGVGFPGLGTTRYIQSGIFLNLSNDANSGRFGLSTGSATPLTLPTYVTSIDSTSKLSFSVGDTIVFKFQKVAFSVIATAINKTTGQVVTTPFYGLWGNSGGRWNLIFMNGTYDLFNHKIGFNDCVGCTVFLNDSHFTGYGNSQYSRTVPSLLFNQNKKFYSVVGMPSVSAKSVVDGGIVQEVLTYLQPKNLVIELGYNDESEGFTAPNTKIAVDSIVEPARRAGVVVSITGLYPRIGGSTDITNDSLQNLATSIPVDFYDVRTIFKLAAQQFVNIIYLRDGVHYNDSAAIITAGVVKAKSAYLLSDFNKDTLYVDRHYSLPSASASDINLIGITSKGSIVKMPNFFPVKNSVILNSLYTPGSTVTSVLPISQIASIRTTGVIASDSAIVSSGVNGGNFTFAAIGANGGRRNLYFTANTAGNAGNVPYFPATTSTANDNVYVSTSGSGQGSAFSGTASRNVIMTSSIVGSTFSGSNIVSIGAGASINTITSGNTNLFMGFYGGNGCTTCTNVIDLQSTLGGSGTGTAALPGTVNSVISIGDKFNTVRNVQQGDIVINPRNDLTALNFYPGGLSNAGSLTYHFPANKLTFANTGGFNGFMQVSPGQGVSNPGNFQIQTFDTALAGLTYQSTAITKFWLDQTGVAIGTNVTAKPNDQALQVPSTTQSFGLPAMTSTQETAVVDGVLSIARTAAGSGYTDGNIPLTFSGGGGSGAAGYVPVISGVATNAPVLTKRGSGYASAPTVSLTPNPGGSGATFTSTIGGTPGGVVYNSTDSTIDGYNGSTWFGFGATKIKMQDGGTTGKVGQVALVSGTKALTITGVTTSSRAFVTLVTPSGVTLTTAYQAVCTANTLTLQANVAAGTINVADGSTLNYFIIN